MTHHDDLHRLCHNIKCSHATDDEVFSNWPASFPFRPRFLLINPSNIEIVFYPPARSQNSQPPPPTPCPPTSITPHTPSSLRRHPTFTLTILDPQTPHNPPLVLLPNTQSRLIEFPQCPQPVLRNNIQLPRSLVPRDTILLQHPVNQRQKQLPSRVGRQSDDVIADIDQGTLVWR
jgi:hypothetical protein